MLPTSHRIPITSADDVALLTEASLSDSFAAFISAASRLEGTHRQLHTEVARLRVELEERNQALASSLRENERMRLLQTQILNALPCGVAVINAEDQKVMMLNPEAEKLLGISGQGKRAKLPDAICSMIESKPSQAWRDGDEQQITVTTQENRWVSVRCTTIDDPIRAAAPQSLILTLRDTTTQKQAEEEREAARNMVAHSEIATVLAHEVRNPLGSLELFTSLLCSDAQIRGEAKNWLHCLQAGIRSLSATVNNVLRFHSPAPAPLQPLNLGDTVAAAVEFISPLAKQDGVVIRLDESLNGAEIMGDAASLQQVFLNLACNALRYTSSEGSLIVRTAIERVNEHKVAIVTFADNGRGISAEALPHVFKAGFSTDGQRTGLGLAVCQRIVRQHHGEISVTSTLGAGTTFRLEFPTI